MAVWAHGCHGESVTPPVGVATRAGHASALIPPLYWVELTAQGILSRFRRALLHAQMVSSA